jgi:GNAT superfamily N-acetyltransferase
MPEIPYTWSSFNKNHPVICRPALPKDTPQVLELTRTIWDGEDYVPMVWGEWMEDTRGLLAVAEWGGRVVGTGKLSLFSPQDVWLEGLRVHPDYEGRGIASHMHDYLINTWLRTGEGTLRLATASFRLPVQHLAERSGFSKIAEFSTYTAPPIEGKRHSFSLLREKELSEALEFACKSPTFALSSSLMDLGWQWTAPDEDHIAEAAGRQQAWWWQDRRGLLVIWEDRESATPRPIISIAACAIGDLQDFLLDYRVVVGNAGYDQAGWAAPLHPDLKPILEASGFNRDWEDAVYVYERKHPTRASRA